MTNRRSPPLPQSTPRRSTSRGGPNTSRGGPYGSITFSRAVILSSASRKRPVTSVRSRRSCCSSACNPVASTGRRGDLDRERRGDRWGDLNGERDQRLIHLSVSGTFPQSVQFAIMYHANRINHAHSDCWQFHGSRKINCSNPPAQKGPTPLLPRGVRSLGSGRRAKLRPPNPWSRCEDSGTKTSIIA